MASKNYLLIKSLLLSFLLVLVIDRYLALKYFGFVYTDIDQMVMWNGALDYSRGIFHEPFFYGQSFNYMAESMLAVPLLWISVPIYVALPFITSLISIFPFLVLFVFFYNREKFFWAALSLAFTVLLPIEYNFLTSLPRGFVQAHIFIPLLFIPLFNPEKERNIIFLFLGMGACLVANPSSVLIAVPVFFYVFPFHFRKLGFYVKGLLIIPFFLVDHWAKHFYVEHPDRILHALVGVELSTDTFIASASNIRMFENLFPFSGGAGFLYPLLFILLAFLAWKKYWLKEAGFIVCLLFLLLLTFFIPKVQEVIEGTGIFFTSSRLYLCLPLLLIISGYLVFRKINLGVIFIASLFVVTLFTFIYKNIGIEKKAEKIYAETIFPVAKNRDLLKRAFELEYLSKTHNIELIINTTNKKWPRVFDSYAFNPLMSKFRIHDKNVLSLSLGGDRRSWLFDEAKQRRVILFNGFEIENNLLNSIQHQILGPDLLAVSNSKMSLDSLLSVIHLPPLGNGN